MSAACPALLAVPGLAPPWQAGARSAARVAGPGGPEVTPGTRRPVPARAAASAGQAAGGMTATRSPGRENAVITSRAPGPGHSARS